MTFSKIIFLLCFLLAGTNIAHASVSEGTPIEADTLAPLAQWVAQATHVMIPALPITVASGRRLKMSLGLKDIQRARAVAAYLPGQIIINNVVWDPDSLRAQSYLVHELVHHAQLLSGKVYPCHAAKEREAYILQNKWLTEHGEEPIASPEWIDGISSCSGGSAYDPD